MSDKAKLIERLSDHAMTDLEGAYGRSFDRESVRMSVVDFVCLRDPTEPVSADERMQIACGAAMTLLGSDYRPPSPTSDYCAPVRPALAFDAVLGLARVARNWTRDHTAYQHAEELEAILDNLVSWMTPLVDAFFDQALMPSPSERGDTGLPGEYDVLVTARLASRAADALSRAADGFERDYLEHEGADDGWMTTIEHCAELRSTVDDLRDAAGEARDD